MSLRFYNTLTRKVEEFAPMDGKTVRMYVCGPTVYDDPHIGHARSAYIFDVLCRYLKYKKFTVTFVRNVTDVDDKIIDKARAFSVQRSADSNLQSLCVEVADKYLKSYHETMDRLGIGRPTQEPLATGHIDEMLNLISQLVLNGSAYETKTGDVYFAVRKFPGYGKLSNRSIDELQAGTRVEPGEQKHDPLDFALWKAAKPDEPSWSSPWGKGRPGWHIECSAMSTKYLGDEFDIHGGGVDLIFPHHENEIAQAQAAGKKFARFWIHNGLLTVNGEKMSKSLGNFITVEQALKECGEPDVLKMFFLSAHYRSPIDFTKGGVLATVRRYFHHIFFMDRGLGRVGGVTSAPSPKIEELSNEFLRVMDEDLNTPQALAVLDKISNLGLQTLAQLNTESRQSEDALPLKQEIRSTLDALKGLGSVLGLFGQYTYRGVGQDVEKLLEDREAARRRKDFKAADTIREQLWQKGIEIEDTPSGPIPHRIR